MCLLLSVVQSLIFMGFSSFVLVLFLLEIFFKCLVISHCLLVRGTKNYLKAVGMACWTGYL